MYMYISHTFFFTVSVDSFKVTIKVENVTETSLVISWMNGMDYSGVHVYYIITFNDSVVSNVSSPHLIKNLTDGEIHSVMITSNIRGRDMRLSAVNSNLEYVRTGKHICIYVSFIVIYRIVMRQK